MADDHRPNMNMATPEEIAAWLQSGANHEPERQPVVEIFLRADLIVCREFAVPPGVVLPPGLKTAGGSK